MFDRRLSRWLLTLALITASGLALSIASGLEVRAGEVKLKNGMTLKGTATDIESLLIGPRKPDKGPVPIYPIVMISSPLERYFIPRGQKDSVNKDVELARHEGFKLSQPKLRGKSRVIGSVQGYLENPGAFDEFGRRKLKLETSNGETPVIQGVTQITPEYLKIDALDFTWETATATTSISPESLDAMLRNPNVTQQDNPDHRIAIARFYIDAAMYGPAQRELEAIRQKFPELAQTANQVQITLRQALAQDVLNELKLRRAAGQHQFVYETAKNFPTENVAAPILREVRDIAAAYEAANEKRVQAVDDLSNLQGELKGDPRVKEIAPLRAEISEKLNVSNLERLDAFSRLAVDSQLKADEKLALALSGWVVGSPNAVTEIDQALRLWQARFLVLDYLRTAVDADPERKAILEKLESMEGVGPERIAQILPLLPPTLDPRDASPGRAFRIEVPVSGDDELPTAYWVLLPFEYHADRQYPLIVALYSERGGPQQELMGFWGGGAGQAQRHGYIVIAPEYVPKSNSKGYDYNPESHQIVLDSFRDALRRFSVDSDRVFLSGHGMGGDAAWDIGLSHPHLFAGVIPVSGAIDKYSMYYWENGRQLPLYVVSGELDRDLMTRNAPHLMRMMQQNFDLIYAEYVGAGPDVFYSEIHSLFDWMSRQKRPAPPSRIDVKSLRPTDNRFYWYEGSGLPEGIGIDWTSEKKRKATTMGVDAAITQGNTLRLRSGAARHRLWLPRGEGLIDFQKRLKVEINGRSRWNNFVKPDTAAMLEHVRLSGDRQQLYWAVLDF